jgi:hypothetical protein
LLTFRVRPKRFGSFRHAKKNGGDSPKPANSTAEFRIIRGLAELLADPGVHDATGRVRCPGGERKKLTTTDTTLLIGLRGLMEPATRGDPEGAAAVDQPQPAQSGRGAPGDGTSHRLQCGRRPAASAQLQPEANRKTREGSHNPDRDAQFGLTHPPRILHALGCASGEDPAKWLVHNKAVYGFPARQNGPLRC